MSHECSIKNQVSVGPVVMGTGFGRTYSCSNPRNTLGRGMEPNHPELGLDSGCSPKGEPGANTKKKKKKTNAVQRRKGEI